jgi:hypothetical protein
VLFLAGIYGSGYLVVSVYHASLGLNELSPLRPKVVFAGVLFLSLTAYAAFLDWYVQSVFWNDVKDLVNKVLKVAYLVLAQFCFYLFAAAPMMVLFRETAAPSSIWITGGFVVILVSLFFVLAFHQAHRLPWMQRWISGRTITPVCIILIVALAASLLKYGGLFRQFMIFLVAVTVVTRVILTLIKKGNIPDFQEWSLIPLLVVLPILIFGTWVYPHMRAAFGGGEPTQADLWLTLPDGNKGVQKVRAKIVDETDSGFYLIEDGEARVRYVPRSAINAVVFDKPQEWLF